ncbi:hypothetical protein G7Y89_g13427 [Cudoniella acicularis]|uniref:Uncharacterized protein n=1 Tax=Cudoniella acicularis TaxID=354080 RepID=A0A8H4R8A2_9HELO|nr:hypothetical protein G7Y89_g13427 [Cudoniella acicularis]
MSHYPAKTKHLRNTTALVLNPTFLPPSFFHQHNHLPAPQLPNKAGAIHADQYTVTATTKMATTRSGHSSPDKAATVPKPKAGTKRKSPEKSHEKPSADPANPPKKRGRPPKKAKKEQKTIEETIANSNGEAVEETKAKENGHGEESSQENSNATDHKGIENGEKEKAESGDAVKEPEKNAFEEVKSDSADAKAAAQSEQEDKSADITANNASVVADADRDAAVSSSILEKGIIYFFFRGRVGIEDPQSLEDVARSYIVLRPLPIGAKIGEGPMQDDGRARLLALPKKMLPKSRRDRFLTFVEKSGVSIKDIREQFASSEYATKTSGTSNTPAATPSAEGIYAIISTGRESHLAYHVTIPKEIGEVQKELGINKKGSFVVSAKNPEASGPANSTLGNPAKYLEEIQKKFCGLRWMPLIPELLEYEATQFLVIGEGMGELGKVVEEQEKDKENNAKKKPVEEVEKLEEEDHDRVEGLKEDDPVFADLDLSSKEYPHLQTTW